ncbi:Type II secretion system F domain protein (plasmid) [Streptomyces sp. 769]|nr:Type II secretion system F domain protein [Streptomyces sp. 769]
MISMAGVVYGAMVGGGAFLVVRELLPSRPDLGSVLDRLENTTPAQATVRQGAAKSAVLTERVGARILASAGERLSVPRRDLDLLGISPAKHVGDKVIGAVGGFAMPQMALALAAAAGIHLPFVLPLFVSVAFAAMMWVSADTNVHSKAVKLRLEYRYAVASLMERARLQRGAHAAPEKALYETAAVGDGRVYVRIRAALEQAKLSGTPPWDALKAMSEQLDVPELAGPADTFAHAGTEGANIIAALENQSRTLRKRLQTDIQSEANADSEKAVVPGTILFVVLIATLGYPLFQTVLGN